MKSRLALVAALLLTTKAMGDEAPSDRLAGFVRDACEYLRVHFLIKPQDAQPHFGRLVRSEMISKHVASPRRRYYFEPQTLTGWEVWMERPAEVVITVPATVSITLGDLERYFGAAEEEVTDRRLVLTKTGSEPSAERKFPFQFQLTHLGTNKTCTVVLETDGRYKDFHKQRVLKLAIYE
jgi:hypothetical protein